MQTLNLLSSFDPSNPAIQRPCFYRAVTYLDADTIVLKSIDDVFGCKGFCAVLRHSERLNSGFMVVEPSKELFDDMMDKIATTPSYTGGKLARLPSRNPMWEV